jgi:excinuclease ABC subunit B
MIDRTYKQMEKAAKDLEYLQAAKLRDEWQALKEMLAEKK